jgi:hypothetical protein
MTKYIVFGWSHEGSVDGFPADEMLGTTDDIQHADQEYFVDEDTNETTFGLKLVEQEVELQYYLMRGRALPMTVLITYGKHGPESGRPLIAYYEVPGT